MGRVAEASSREKQREARRRERLGRFTVAVVPAEQVADLRVAKVRVVRPGWHWRYPIRDEWQVQVLVHDGRVLRVERYPRDGETRARQRCEELRERWQRGNGVQRTVASGEWEQYPWDGPPVTGRRLPVLAVLLVIAVLVILLVG